MERGWEPGDGSGKRGDLLRSAKQPLCVLRTGINIGNTLGQGGGKANGKRGGRKEGNSVRALQLFNPFPTVPNSPPRRAAFPQGSFPLLSPSFLPLSLLYSHLHIFTSTDSFPLLLFHSLFLRSFDHLRFGFGLQKYESLRSLRSLPRSVAPSRAPLCPFFFLDSPQLPVSTPFFPY